MRPRRCTRWRAGLLANTASRARRLAKACALRLAGAAPRASRAAEACALRLGGHRFAGEASGHLAREPGASWRSPDPRPQTQHPAPRIADPPDGAPVVLRPAESWPRAGELARSQPPNRRCPRRLPWPRRWSSSWRRAAARLPPACSRARSCLASPMVLRIFTWRLLRILARDFKLIAL